MSAKSGKDPHSVVEVAIGALIVDGVALVDGADARPRVLLSRRTADQALAGCWELPGGKIEPGETPAAALVREFDEELGLAVVAGEPFDVIEHRYDHATVRLRPLRCTLAPGQPPTPLNRQVAAHRWATADELAEAELPAANAPLTARLIVELREMEARAASADAEEPSTPPSASS